MKALNFNKNSWHYKLVTKFQLYETPGVHDVWGDGSWMRPYGDSADICTYSKKVVLALFLIFLAVVGISFVLYILIHTLLGIGFSLWAGQWLFSEPGVFGLTVSGIILMFFTIFVILGKLAEIKERWLYRPRVEKPDSFVKHAYKSWKNKFCLPIKFIE